MPIYTCRWCGQDYNYYPSYDNRRNNRGYCGRGCIRKRREAMQYVRKAKKIKRILSAFWSRKKITDVGCWEWQGSIHPNGYGMSITDGHRWKDIENEMGIKKSRWAHRLAYLIYYGKIHEEMQVLHKCDNPKCINPDHLFLGTAADNCRDRHEKGRDAKGEKNGSARLTERKVLSAREEYKLGGLTITELSVKYNVSFTTISAAVRGITWKHLGRLHG